MTGVVSGGGSSMGPAATACTAWFNITSHGSTANSSANKTEGARVPDVREVTTGDESPVGGKRAQTVAGRTDEGMASRVI